MGLGTAISNFASEQAKSKPQIALIFITVATIFILFSERLFNVSSTNRTYLIVMVCLITLIMSVVTASTFMHILNLTNNSRVNSFSNVFNSPGSKNYFAVFLLLLYVMRIYELPIYDNNYPHSVTDKILFGHNTILSNRTLGVLVMFGFCISTAYMIYSTTRELSE